MEKGLVHLYYGDGKGKTTAALGLALRALGCGRRVVLVQFLKNTPCGELTALACHDGMTVLRGKAGAHFTFAMTEEERTKTKEIHESNLTQAMGLAQKGQCDLLILDEVTDALQTGLLDEELLRQAVLKKADGLELVMTGHHAIGWLVQAADYVTEMKKCKHPFDRGIPAREGVEF
ncbi:MAG: cob(I)yrinic acid a,c-diamide adenosyltransferase [Oscillospiraceae bacterium]|jgi:cob(I)alamin adenosyltransferase|nr:cob(I)yrinic acid a,c-diamide adenosyltransferase [Oscillospiraceae bacterium]